MSSFRVAAAIAAILVTLVPGAAHVADAGLTTPTCLARKQIAWANRRHCEGVETAKQLGGKAGDIAKCASAFASTLAKTTDKASKAGIPCRYLDDGDGTVTDYDTGLQWEQKVTGSDCLHCVDDTYTWTIAPAVGVPYTGVADGTAFTSFLARLIASCTSADSDQITNGFADHCDWRLPTIAELKTIADPTQGKCVFPFPDVACVDPVFGPTAGNYWSSTVYGPDNTWSYNFFLPSEDKTQLKWFGLSVRAVRTAF